MKIVALELERAGFNRVRALMKRLAEAALAVVKPARVVRAVVVNVDNASL